MKDTKRMVCRKTVFFMLLFLMIGGMNMQASETEWEYSLNEETGEAVLTAYHGSETAVVIPEILGGAPVTAVGEGAFQGNVSMVSVVIPDTVAVIGSRAFQDCQTLTDVTMSQGLKRIEASAFASSKVKEIHIPDSVTYVGAYAFSDCTGLRTLVLGSGIQEWGDDWGTNGAFSDCTLLSSLTVKEGVTSIGPGAFSGCTLLLEAVLPSSVTSVGNEAFRDCELLDTVTVYGSVGDSAFLNCTNLKNVTLVNTVQIGASAFENNTAMSRIAFPETLTSIGNGAFRSCTKLESAEIPDSVAFVGAYAFEGCTQLERAVLGSGIQEWGNDWGANQAFAGCTKLSSLVIREGITDLPQGIFRGCTALEKIEIPGSVINIGDEAFSDCQKLASAAMGEGIQNIGNSAFVNCTQLHTANLPESLLSVGNSAFRYTQLRRADIPDKVSSIGCYAFADCPALQAVSLGESVETWVEDWGTNGAFMNNPRLEKMTIKEGVLSIGPNAFENCTSLKEAEIPITVTAVGSHAFAGCTALSSVSMQRGEIGESAFENCWSLCRLSLERITSIGDNAFSNNTALYDLILPDTVTVIGNGAFRGCCSLSSLVLPESVTSLGAYAFADCTGLQSAELGNNITEWVSDWGTNGAFMNDTALLYVTVDEGANSLGARLFSDCTSLMDVSLPESIVTWSEDLFENCPDTLLIHVSGPQMQALANELGRKTSQEVLVIPEPVICTLTISADGNGSVSPEGKIEKPYGSQQKLFVTPDRGYILEQFTVDGAVYDWNNPISAIGKDMTIYVTFAADPAYVDEYPDLESETDEGIDPADFVRFTEEDASFATANIYLAGMLRVANIFADGQPSAETDPVTAAAAVTLLYSLEETIGSLPQIQWVDYGPNVPADSGYGQAVVWAVQTGIMEEEQARNFAAQQAIDAQTLSLWIYRYAAWKGITVGPAETNPLPENEAEWALAWARENGWETVSEGSAQVQCSQMTHLMASFLADYF